MSRNIVLITIDSFRADHCGFMGCDLDLTPSLDEIADRSIVYEHALAPGPRTPSSMPAIFTGEFFQRHNRGVYTSWEEKRTHWKARQDRVRRHMRRFRTLAERLQARGYNTAGITANPWTTRRTGFDTGFDTFQEVGGLSDDSTPTGSLWNALERVLGVELEDWLLTWPNYFTDIVETEAELTEPYFLWVFLLDPHQPYITPRRFRSETTAASMYYSNARYNWAHSYTETLPQHLERLLERAYRDTIRSIDGFVNEMWNLVAEDEPVFVVHADHGEAFQEHGTYGHRPQLYGENLRVPFVVHTGNNRARVEKPISLGALPDVVCSLVDSNRFDSTIGTANFVRSETEECERVAVRSPEWALLHSPRDWQYVHGVESIELYDLRDDSLERSNVAELHSEVTTAIRRLLAQSDADGRERGLLSHAVRDLETETDL